jgi:hypothetical protein
VLETQFSGDSILLVFPDGTSPALLSAMMGGIPYNRVHELEFQPGEVRLDVTYQRVRDHLQQQEQDADAMTRYQTTLKQGQVEWDRLQSIKIDDLISKKDQNIEKERLEIELQYQQNQDERQAQQEAERQAREDILAQREVERQLKRQQQLPGDGMSSMPLGVMGGVAAAVSIGLAAMIGGRNVEEELLVPVLAAPTNNLNTTIGLDSSLANSILEGISAAPGTLPLSSSSSPSLFDNPPPPLPLTEEDRQAAAQQAMNAYLDQDDGGDAWLQVMSDLVQQPEDDEDETDSYLLQNSENDIRIDEDGIITAKKINGSTHPIGNSITRTLDDDNEKDGTI